jgi:hypothetical protein
MITWWDYTPAWPWCSFYKVTTTGYYPLWTELSPTACWPVFAYEGQP